MAWDDWRSGNGNIYARRLDSTGAFVGSEILVSSARGDQGYPAVAAATTTGVDYFVIWQDARKTSNGEVYGAWLTTSGSVLPSAGEPLFTAVNEQHLPSAAWNGSNWLVVWQDSRNTSWDIYGVGVSPTGTVLQPNGIPISTAVNAQTRPSVAATGSSFLVAWQDLPNNTPAIRAARVSNSFQLLDANALQLASLAAGVYGPDVAGNGTNWLVVWHDLRNNAVSGVDIYGGQVTMSGTLVQPGGFAINQATGSQGGPKVAAAATGGDYVVVWHDSRADGGDIYGTNVTTAGSVGHTSGVPIASISGTQEAPDIAARAPNSYLVVWKDYRDEIRGTTLTGTSPDGPARVLASSEVHSPAVSWDGSAYLLVWTQQRSSFDIVAHYVAADASPLGTPFDISADAGDEIYPTVAGANSGWSLVAYRSKDTTAFGTTERIAGRLVSGDSDGDGYSGLIDDCDDGDPAIRPGAPESCDWIDSNCNGSLVDGFPNFDGDGLPDCIDADDDNDGDPDTTDCAPLDPSRHQWANEVCDGANADENCNGLANDDDPTLTGPPLYYVDADGDGYGAQGSTAVPRCSAAGYVLNDLDCSDASATVYPGAAELCDATDSDCDGSLVDECPDFDGDGLPDAVDPTIVVSPVDGLVTTEAGGTASFTVVLTVAPTNPVTVHFGSSDWSEGVPSTTSVDFGPEDWSVPKTVIVQGVDDTLTADGDIAYLVTGSSASADAAYDGLTMRAVGVTNRDDDIPGPTNAAELPGYAAQLYTGENPRQPGVTPGTIDSKRVAIARGKVMTAVGTPLAGVLVSVLYHPEYGSTLSDAEGFYEMAVNGGEQLTVHFWMPHAPESPPPYQEVQRASFVPILNYTWFEDALLIGYDVGTPVFLGTSQAPVSTDWQMHVSSISYDDDGPRKDVLIIPEGVGANVRHADGTTTGITGTVVLRSTEYTIGNQERMPAALPAGSAYTYAVEHSFDGYEGENVELTGAIYEYVDNFLGFPGGTAVPSGRYDRATGYWVPSVNGCVVNLLAIIVEGDGVARAQLDTDNDELVDNGGTACVSGAIAAEERRLVALAYPDYEYDLPKALWRVPLNHFSPSDLNWPPIAYVEGMLPDGADPTTPTQEHPAEPCTQTGSIISCESQTLSEKVPIVGTPFHLAYSSDKVPGRKDLYGLRIPLRGQAILETPPLGIELVVSIARNRVRLHVPTDTSGTSFTMPYAHGSVTISDNVAYFYWDGRDADNRVIRGAQTVHVRIGFRYRIQYGYPSNATNAFALPANYGSGNASAALPDEPLPCLPELDICPGRWHTLWRQWSGKLGTRDARLLDLGGWALDVQHAYDPEHLSLYRSTGGRPVENEPDLDVQTASSSVNDGHHAKTIAIAADGTMYKTTSPECRIWKRSPGQAWTHIAGLPGANSCGAYNGSGVATEATEVRLSGPEGIAIARDGSLYIAEPQSARILRLKDGLIATFAGTGVSGFSGDDGPRANARFNMPSDVAVGPDGSIYVADTYNQRVRRIMTDGTVYTVAGCGAATLGCSYADGRYATEAFIASPWNVEVGADETLYILSGTTCRVLKVTADGKIYRAAGGPGNDYGQCAFSGDGGLATSARLYNPKSMTLGYDGTLFILDGSGAGSVRRIRSVDEYGVINTVAGGVDYADSGDFNDKKDLKQALETPFCAPYDLAFGWPGRVYMTDLAAYGSCTHNHVHSFGGNTAWIEQRNVFVPSDDGGQIYEFTPAGQHVGTKDALTGASIYKFIYDGSGKLQYVQHNFRTDAGGSLAWDVTEIQRDAQGVPTAIIAPGGQVTSLVTDANGYLALVNNPANEQVSMTYTADGLLTQLVDARNGVHKFQYDSLGRLIVDEDPRTVQDDTPTSRGQSWRTLSRSNEPNGYDVSIATPLGLATEYEVRLVGGEMRRTITTPGAPSMLIVHGADGSTVTTAPDGTITTETESKDPRFGKAAPLRSRTVQTPAGRTAVLMRTRSAKYADPNDASTLTEQEDTFLLNGRATKVIYTRTDDAGISTRALERKGPGCNDTDANTPCRRAKASLDEHARLTEVDPDGASSSKLATASYTYDPTTGQLESVTLTSPVSGEGSRTFSFGYYASGPANKLLETVTQPDTQVITLGYDDAGRLNASSIPGQSGAGEYVEVTHEPDGNLQSVRTPTTQDHLFTYDAVGLPDQYMPPVVEPHGAEEFWTDYEFDVERRLTGVMDFYGQGLSLDYDPTTGRLSQVTSTSPARVLQYGYDAQGRVSLMASSSGYDGVLEYTYDGFLLLSETWSGGAAEGSVTRVYGNDFRVKDQLVRLCWSCSDDELVSGADDFIYDVDGLLTKAGDLVLGRDPTTGQLTGSTLGGFTTTHQYNGFGEPKLTSARDSTSTMVYSEEIVARDAMGRITSREESIEGVSTSYTYSYWPMGRLKQVDIDGACAAHYTYDDNGNRLSTSCSSTTPIASYDAQDRLDDYDGTSYTYTPTGRLETKTSGSEVTSYVYDAMGNLLTVMLPDARQLDYAVDARGRRIGKLVDGVLEKRWLYQDELRPVAQVDEVSGYRMRFVYGTGRNVPDYMIIYDGEWQAWLYRLVTDHLGSVRLVVDVATDTVVQRLDYDAWGVVVGDTNPGFQPFGFAGGLYDPDTGLVRFGARDYDPSVGRWTAKDPILFRGGQVNLYVYVNSDPVNLSDPTGLVTSVIVTFDHGFGSHAAVYVDNGADPVLYDPGGSYRSGQRGSGDAFTGSEANLLDYLIYQHRSGSDVLVLNFATTPQEEAQIASAIDDLGGQMKGLCASGVSDVLTGIGPFKDLRHTFLPGHLARQLGYR